MNNRGTLLLLLAVVAVGALLAIEGGFGSEEEAPGGRPGPQRQETPATPLMGVGLDEVKSVELTDEGVVVRVDRPASGWKDAEVADAMIDFIGTIGRLGEIQRIQAESAALGDYGLAPARRKIRVERDAGEALELQLGDRNPAGTGLYVRRASGGDVILAGALVEWEFEKLLRRLRPTPAA